MSSYSELVKSFERIRSYMREFYVYGFKSREEYDGKSARSYDDERRRIESWLGEHMRFLRTADGKNVFLSIDSRAVSHNPLYKAWRAKSFTDGDIALHFILFDILYDSTVRLSLSDILKKMDKEYLSTFKEPMVLDESTVRKKLKEYEREGIVCTERVGRRVFYRRAPDAPSVGSDALHFFSEVTPCGVIGAFLLDKEEENASPFVFKHHYITGAIDSGILATLLDAMQKKCSVIALNLARKKNESRRVTLVPLRVLISAQNGREHLVAYCREDNTLSVLRIDHLSHARLGTPAPDFDELRAHFEKLEKSMWGVCLRPGGKTEHVEFVLRIEKGEEYVLTRLEREKRFGTVERIDETHYRFFADVYDTGELLPWIRTFISRLMSLHFSNRTLENRFKQDLLDMYRMYGVEEGVR